MTSLYLEEKPAEPSRTRWICTADARGAKLLRCGVAPPGRCHVELADSLVYETHPHNHDRTNPVAGRRDRISRPQGHESENQLHQIAKQLTAWLERNVNDRRLERVVVFAPPKLLGVLRKTYPPALNSRLRAREADLAHLDAHALAHHPTVRQLIGLPESIS